MFFLVYIAGSFTVVVLKVCYGVYSEQSPALPWSLCDPSVGRLKFSPTGIRCLTQVYLLEYLWLHKFNLAAYLRHDCPSKTTVALLRLAHLKGGAWKVHQF